MREIKFRAWDTINKKMIADLICFYPGTSGRETDLSWKNEFGHDFEVNGKKHMAYMWGVGELIIEQYTGLKDCEGKEIYEGDIVEEACVGELVWDGAARILETPKGVIEYVAPLFNLVKRKAGLVEILEEGMFNRHIGDKYPIFMSCYDGVFEWFSDDKIKVSGNIHENPELLEASHEAKV